MAMFTAIAVRAVGENARRLQVPVAQTAVAMSRPSPLYSLLLLLPALCLLDGCAVASVAGAAVSVGATAVSVGAGAVGLAADAAIGTARLTGKAVGAAVDAASGGDDHSGVNIRFREPTAADREKRRLAEQQAEEEDRRAAGQLPPRGDAP